MQIILAGSDPETGLQTDLSAPPSATLSYPTYHLRDGDASVMATRRHAERVLQQVDPATYGTLCQIAGNHVLAKLPNVSI